MIRVLLIVVFLLVLSSSCFGWNCIDWALYDGEKIEKRGETVEIVRGYILGGMYYLSPYLCKMGSGNHYHAGEVKNGRWIPERLDPHFTLIYERLTLEEFRERVKRWRGGD